MKKEDVIKLLDWYSLNYNKMIKRYEMNYYCYSLFNNDFDITRAVELANDAYTKSYKKSYYTFSVYYRLIHFESEKYLIKHGTLLSKNTIYKSYHDSGNTLKGINFKSYKFNNEVYTCVNDEYREMLFTISTYKGIFNLVELLNQLFISKHLNSRKSYKQNAISKLEGS